MSVCAVRTNPWLEQFSTKAILQVQPNLTSLEKYLSSGKIFRVNWFVVLSHMCMHQKCISLHFEDMWPQFQYFVQTIQNQ